MTGFTKTLIAVTLGIAIVAVTPAEAETYSNGLSRNGWRTNGVSPNGWRTNGSELAGWTCTTGTEQDGDPGSPSLRVIGIELPL